MRTLEKVGLGRYKEASSKNLGNTAPLKPQEGSHVGQVEEGPKKVWGQEKKRTKEGWGKNWQDHSLKTWTLVMPQRRELRGRPKDGGGEHGKQGCLRWNADEKNQLVA